MSAAADHRALTTLVLGGARSGKSAYAERLVEGHEGALVYLATAEPGDAEMTERIAGHKARRGGRWRTVEEPLALTEALGAAVQPGSAVLVDCLTIWLSNLLLAGRDVEMEMAQLVAVLGELSNPVVLVSNEVGLGIVPENALARAFRDHAGRLNQMVAQAADQVVLVAAGLPMILKPARELEMSA
ncbi:MAG TPA: bifunctional adenosylcobinamide kinase/adenosylcobinamide-phosphate guanylyltransferase [Alphaproteobacteria bacterium]|nr:bifunctional adenosylcobinamide kinase/adenosylcobinamide-phosphate guanylyltransferase [Alphaproteobacteria bacterium]